MNAESRGGMGWYRLGPRKNRVLTYYLSRAGTNTIPSHPFPSPWEGQ